MAIAFKTLETMRPMEMKAHPLAELFPLMEGEAFAEFMADIRTHGLREPIVLLDGEVLDGRNRLRACKEAAVEPRFTEYRGDDPAAFVVSLNLKRRHLSESQRAFVAGKLATLPKGANQHAQICAPSQSEAAKMLNVSRGSVQMAKQVQKTGAPEVAKAVESGEVSIAAASAIAKTTPAEQAIIIALDPKKRKEMVRKLREEQSAETFRETARKMEATGKGGALATFFKKEGRRPNQAEAQQIARIEGVHIRSTRGHYESPMPPDELAEAQRKADVVGSLILALEDVNDIAATPQEAVSYAEDYDVADISEKLPKAVAWLVAVQEEWNRHGR